MTPTTPGAPLGPGKPTITGYRPINRGALIAEAKLMFWALLIITVDYFKTDTGRWVNFPARTFQKKSGGLGRVPLFEFANPEVQKAFQEAALAAIDDFVGQTPEAASPPEAAPIPEDPPKTGGEEASS